MTRRSKVVTGIVAVLALTVGALALVLSHNTPCGVAPAVPTGMPIMKAAVYRCYGPTDVLKVEAITKPIPAADRVLIKVYAASVNPLDWHYLRGSPYIMRAMIGIGVPDDIRLGVDFSGTVEAVGAGVTRFKPGDEVFGGADGSFAEYLTARAAGSIALKPSNMSFEQAAAVPIAAVTALQALRDHGHLQRGSQVLINGASGGVGSFAVQIAKVLGAEVTGVSSGSTQAMVRSLGADQVIDYTREDFTQGSQRYDLVLDLVGNRDLLDIRRVLKPHAIYIGLGGGGPNEGGLIGPLKSAIKESLLSPFVSQKFMFFTADLNANDLSILHDLMQAGRVKPVIDKRYPLSEAAAAIRYLEAGHAHGKVVIDVLPQ